MRDLHIERRGNVEGIFCQTEEIVVKIWKMTIPWQVYSEVTNRIALKLDKKYPTLTEREKRDKINTWSHRSFKMYFYLQSKRNQ
jgi:hypothetical protein